MSLHEQFNLFYKEEKIQYYARRRNLKAHTLTSTGPNSRIKANNNIMHLNIIKNCNK